MGAPAWAEDDRFQTLSGRLAHQALLSTVAMGFDAEHFSRIGSLLR